MAAADPNLTASAFSGLPFVVQAKLEVRRDCSGLSAILDHWNCLFPTRKTSVERITRIPLIHGGCRLCSRLDL